MNFRFVVYLVVFVASPIVAATSARTDDASFRCASLFSTSGVISAADPGLSLFIQGAVARADAARSDNLFVDLEDVPLNSAALASKGTMFLSQGVLNKRFGAMASNPKIYYGTNVIPNSAPVLVLEGNTESVKPGNERWSTEEFILPRSKSLSPYDYSPGAIKDVYRVTARVQKDVAGGRNGGAFFEDLIRVGVHRFSENRQAVASAIRFSFRIGRSIENSFEPLDVPDGFLVTDVHLPSSVPVESVVRKILVPHPRDLEGEFTVYVELKDGTVRKYSISVRTLQSMQDNPGPTEATRKSGDAFALEAVMTSSEFNSEMGRLQVRR